MPFVAISTSTSGDNTLVAARPGQKIRVINYAATAAGDVAIKFKSGASTDLTGAMGLSATKALFPSGSGLSPAGFVGLFETAVGEALVLNLSDAVAVAGHLTFQSL